MQEPVRRGFGFRADLTGAERALSYRFHLREAEGVSLGFETVMAQCDDDAVQQARRRLERAAIVDVWRHARWICSLQRGPATPRGAG